MANLNDLAIAIAEEESGDEINIAQIKEVIGILGKRWRKQDFEVVISEVRAIIERAGTHGSEQ